MKIEGKNIISAPAQKVWEALNDPQILTEAIPGCEALEKLSDTKFKATVVTKIGPIKVKFDGEAELSDLQPPDSYTLSGHGTGGPAGNARGSAAVRLLPFDGGTLLSYEIDAEVTGKLAQLGQRLIVSTTKMLAGKFFDKLNQLIGVDGGGEAAHEAGAEEEEVFLLDKEVSGYAAEPVAALADPLLAETQFAAEASPIDEPPGETPTEAPRAKLPLAEVTPADPSPPPQPTPSAPKPARRTPKPARSSRSEKSGMPLYVRIAMIAGGLSLAFLVYVWTMGG